MPEEDRHLVYQALNIWANYIETGDPTISMNDAIRCGTPEKIKMLDFEQQKFIIRLRSLAGKELNKC